MFLLSDLELGFDRWTTSNAAVLGLPATVEAVVGVVLGSVLGLHLGEHFVALAEGSATDAEVVLAGDLAANNLILVPSVIRDTVIAVLLTCAFQALLNES